MGTFDQCVMLSSKSASLRVSGARGGARVSGVSRRGAAGRSYRRSSSAVAMSVTSEATPPLVGNPEPGFSAEAVFDQEFINVTLDQYKGNKYVVLFFYPLDFTFVCPTEITAFSDRYEEFSATDTEVLGVSVDSQFSHLAWVQTSARRVDSGTSSTRSSPT